MSSRIRVYMGCSVDGFIAGPDDDLSFLENSQKDENGNLPKVDEDGPAVQYHDFIKDIGVILMGRNTYEVVNGMDIPWPYGDMPILVLTSRPLESPPPTVKRVAGAIHEVIDTAKKTAGEKDVYLDGGNLIRQALDAGLVDELTITMVPILLGKGISLFPGLQKECLLEFQEVHRFNQKSIQIIAKPKKASS